MCPVMFALIVAHIAKERSGIFLPWALEIIAQVPSKNLAFPQVAMGRPLVDGMYQTRIILRM